MGRMKCGVCGGSMAVTSSIRAENGTIYRRRKCKKCNTVICTEETEIAKDTFNMAAKFYQIKRKREREKKQ